MVRVGDPLPHLDIYLRRNGKHGMILHWQDPDNGQPQPAIDGTTMRLIIGDVSAPVRMLDTVVDGSTSTWHFSQADMDLPFDLYDGLILVISGTGDETPIADCKFIVEPG